LIEHYFVTRNVTFMGNVVTAMGYRVTLLG